VHCARHLFSREIFTLYHSGQGLLNTHIMLRLLFEKIAQ
jgi:hypothetical protein